MVRDVFRIRRRDRNDGSGAILSTRQHELLAAELELLQRLTDLLVAYPATADDNESMDDAAEQLTSLFLLVVVGEFNAGKSAFINALVGARVMPEGVTPTTSVINSAAVRRDEARKRCCRTASSSAPSRPRFLDEITVVDTPGTNAIIREHEALTQQVRAPRRPCPLRHLRRSPVHRERTHLHGEHPRMGQEDHGHRQQDRPAPHDRGRRTRWSSS